MTNRWFSLMSLGLALVVEGAPLSVGMAGGAEQKVPVPATEEKKAEPSKEATETKAAPAAPENAGVAERPAGLVGTVVAVVPESRTLVVDVPLGTKVLRIGAIVTEKTKIRTAGKGISFERLKEGARVRINFRRVATGDQAITVEVL